MEKLDLIIAALQRVELLFEAHGQYPHTLREVNEALTAARELRELKPVAYIENHKAGQNLSWSQDDLPYAKATSLYALDEVTT